MNRKEIKMKIFQKIMTVICVLVIVWFAASYLQIIANNLSEDAEYPSWNLFRILISE